MEITCTYCEYIRNKKSDISVASLVCLMINMDEG